MLDTATRELVKATAPVLREHGLTLTRHFYARMFRDNPELKAVFNQGHQRAGTQQQALALAVAAYAEHIDAPMALLPVLERIAHKHASLGIRAEHYPVVGRHLLASIQEVLGEAATPALVEAWAAAYGQLADVLIGLERQLYQQAATQEGGWSGWRGFRVQRKTAESEEITSFELAPADGGAVPLYSPGQYLSVRMFVPALGLHQPRQYSLSAAPGGRTLVISVKREAPDHQRPEGLVSNLLHDTVREGDVIEVAPPMGDFRLHTDRTTPVVLISGGVGVTPMVAMLEHLAASDSPREVHFLHACRHGGVHAFADRVNTLTGRLPKARRWVAYEHPRAEDLRRGDHDAAGRLDLGDLPHALPADADHYLCGPVPFMVAQQSALRARGVPAERIHAEVFGTGGLGG